MRTLVTGGAGFIGSALVDRLAHDGHEVTVLDDLSTGKLDNLADAFASGRVEHAGADVAGPELAGVVAEVRPEVVFHLAAQIDVRRSVDDPVHDAHVNVLGSVALAKAAAECGARLLFAGSGGTAYGEPDPADLPIGEDYPPRPTSPYGVAKRSVEDYLASFRDLHGLEWVSLRLGNVYGPRQDPHGEAGVVAIFCNRLLSGEPVTVFGDGRQTRDYVFVEDVVDAFVAAAGGHEAAVGTRLNVGTGTETSVLELYAALREVTGFGPDPVFAPARPGELQRISLDSRRAEELLGWRPRADLASGLRHTWIWAFQEVNAGSVGG